ncbi:MAG: hypothetical protein WC606_04885, partial [Candidatus Absconditabacterales bacterium]
TIVYGLMSIWAKCSWIDKRELQNLFFLSFFDQGSFDETLEDIWEYGDYVDMHDFETSSEKGRVKSEKRWNLLIDK